MSYASTILGRTGLAGYWKLGETGSGTAIPGTSVLMGGGYVHTPNLSPGTTCTVELWFYATAVTPDQRLWSDDSNSSPRLDGGAVQYYNGTSWVNLTAASAVAVNTWYHAVFVFTTASGGTCTLYLNGEKHLVVTSLAPPTGTNGIDLGKNFIGVFGNAFPGNFKEFAVYNAALTQAQISSHYNAAGLGTYSAVVLAESSLLAYYHLNDASGTTAADSKGSNNGTYSGTVTLNQSRVPSVLGPAAPASGALYLGYIPVGGVGVTLGQANNPAPGIADPVVDFSGGYLHLPPLGVSAPLSLEFWIYPTSTGTDKRLIGPVYLADIAFPTVTFNQGGSRAGKLDVYNGSTWQSLTNTAMTVNTWNQVVLVFDFSGSDRCTAYLNGVLQNTVAGLAGNFGNTVIAFARQFHDSADALSGAAGLFKLAHLSAYNVALSQSDVTASYNIATTPIGLRVSQEPVRTLVKPGDAVLRVSQESVRTLINPASSVLRVSQEPVRTLVNPASSVLRVSHMALRIMRLNSGDQTKRVGVGGGRIGDGGAAGIGGSRIG